MYYKEVYIDEIGDFDWDDLDEDEIGCVRYLVDMYEQEGRQLSCVTFDDDGYTVTLADPRYGDGSYDDEDECSGDLADFDTQED